MVAYGTSLFVGALVYLREYTFLCEKVIDKNPVRNCLENLENFDTGFLGTEKIDGF